MHRRSLIAGAAIVTLTGGLTMSETTEAQTKLDPQNTLYMDLKQGRVVIELFPDLAPKTVARIKELTKREEKKGVPDAEVAALVQSMLAVYV